MASSKETGRAGEDAAVHYLRKNGYKIIERGYRCPFGEVDIIASRKGEGLVFFEVKTRSTDTFGYPEEAVGPKKQRRLIRSSQCYINEQRLEGAARFDVLAVEIEDGGYRVRHIEDAFVLKE